MAAGCLARRCERIRGRHLETSADFGLTAEQFLAAKLAKAKAAETAGGSASGRASPYDGDGSSSARSTSPLPGGAEASAAKVATPLTLADVNGWLDRLASPDTHALGLLRELVPRCSPAEVRAKLPR